MNIEQVGFIVMDEQSSRQQQDLLSDLPLSIIHIILSFVPIRYAIRTSLLAKQWRYIWTSLPYLVFDSRCVNPPYKTTSGENRLIHFISQALLLHKGPILKFQLRLPFINMSRLQLQSINQWLLFLSMNGVRILVLEFQDKYTGFEILSSPYSCHNLTLLKLHIPILPPPLPSFKGFLFLRSLDISARVDSSNIETIVTHSPLLEELTLGGSEFSEMTIRAPKLKFFRLNYGSTHLSLDTPVLEEFIVNFKTIKHFSFHESMVFHHLRIIKLSGVTFDRAEVTMAFIRLITRSPNLQKLQISTYPAWEDDAPELAGVSFLESVPNFTFDSLKVIKMACGCGIDEIKVAKFLLARSPVLERMMYRPPPGVPLSEQKLLNLRAELLSYRPASANPEIEIDESLSFCF